MEHSEASAVWNPALRSDNHQDLIATTKAEPVSLPPSSPTQDTMLSATEPSIPESPVPGVPSKSDEHLFPAETREEFQEEAAEVLSTALGDDQEKNPFNVEPLAGDDTLHSTQEISEPELQPQQPQTQENTSDHAILGLSGHHGLQWFNQQGSADQPALVNGEVGSTNHDFWGSPKSVDNGEDDFFSQLKTQTKPIYFPPEADSRFEEGVPLLDESAEPETPIEPPAQQPGELDGVFDGDENEDDGFFSSDQKPVPENEEQGPFHFNRKSTSQVIDAFSAPRGSTTSPLSPTAEEFGNVLAAAASGSPAQVDEVPEEDLAARWQAELSDDDLAVAPAEDDLAARWQAELDDDDDDDLFLEEETGDATQELAPQMVNGDDADHPAQALGSPFGTPRGSSRPEVPRNSYAPHQPSTSDLVHGVSVPGAITPSTDTPLAGSYLQPRSEPPVPMVRAESFAERSKEGYRSPYDLPEDLAPRRKPPVKPVTAPTVNIPTLPPPRTSSIPTLPPPQQSSALPTPLIGGVTSSQAPDSATVPAPKNFYEELPLPPVRPRVRPGSSGRYTPNPNTPGLAVAQPPPPPAQPTTFSQLRPSGDIPQPQFQQPERLGPYTNSLGSPESAPVVPSVASRYSPKPPTLHPGKPPASPRYSPAPPPTAAPPPPQRYVSQPASTPGQAASLPFQPRTSSPLAHHEKVSYQPPEVPRKSSLPQYPATEPSPFEVHQPDVNTNAPVSPRSAQQPAFAGPIAVDTQAEVPTSYQQTSPPRNPYAPPSYIEEFSRRVTHANPPSSYTPPAEPFVPPRRSQTQSPTQQQPLAPRLSVPYLDPLKRPASVHTPSSPTRPVNAYAPVQRSNRTRAISQSLDFIPPVDGQESDPLGRWKGAPIVKFGFGGNVLSCFPKHVPRYNVGQATPKIKSTPGEVRVARLNDWVPFPESIVHHPGPLRNKSKKKDLVSWLSSKIAAFENEGVSESLQSCPDSQKRHEEKILLWKIVRILVEHDGGVQTSPELQKSLRGVIFPHLQDAESDPTFGNSLQSFATSQPPEVASRSDAADSKSLGAIHNSLLLGEREKAVWSAADSRLWGHAMIIASTLDKTVWKQVVQEFVMREVRSSTANAESLAALYEIFAGNFDESIDELVPPSARAGLQMINKVDGHGTSKNALAGLESWKDTLGLVLSNRSPDDNQALLALGRLLLSYGRIEAAHICLIFSRASVFGGPDDPQASIVLLGADHAHSSPTALLDDDAILLTEAYEYATSVLAGSPTSTLPHLMVFKLIHAWSLTDRGQKAEAQQYCDGIAAAIKASTKPSGYYHQHLFFGVDELSTRLKQTTEGGSWISKPSMEKVSSSMWNRFSNFVAGDDSDAASTGSGKAGEAEFGPFARVSGTPTISRSPSVSDLYGQYPMPAAQPIPTSGPSRYQPNNQYAPNSSPDQGRGRSSLDSQRSASFGLPQGQRRGSLEYASQSDSPMYAGGPFYGSPSAGYQSTPPQTSHMPLAPVDEDMAQQAYPTPTAVPQGYFAHDSPYQPPPAHNSFDQSFGIATPPPQLGESGGYMPPAASTGYEPPSAVANGPQFETIEESEDEKPRRNKSAMDGEDEDELVAQAEALKKAEKTRRDREADEAFRKAAEADAQKAAPAKGSWWFTGWMKGGKKEEMNTAGKPIRAKLGEESSFYYDEELKKWINKKDPNTSTQARATPPPPRVSAPPSRTVSGSSMAPPPLPAGFGSRPPSSAGAPPPPLSGSPVPSSLALPPTPSFGPARSVSTGAISVGGGTSSRPGSSAGPPPRPSTSLSTASSIDDLLGAPTARKGNTSRGRKKGRYIDVMAQ
ncbi:Sec23-binding domain of Sec16-domain-containing protein [Aspergillus cavernicola]|uniref:Protein transport protein sec16 n=1 Tax=Aspergillus cavernicola TaxID=176166 RepID=A0ABR4ILW1_9EURO